MTPVIEAGLNHRLHLCQLQIGEAETPRHVAQNTPHVGVDAAVGISGVQLDLHEHAMQIAIAATLAPELVDDVVQGKGLRLALGEQMLGQPFQRRRQAHLLHDRVGDSDLVGAYPAVGLGNMPHDREGGGEKSSLGAFASVGVSGGRARIVQARDAAVKAMTDGGTDQGAEGTAEHEADATA